MNLEMAEAKVNLGHLAKNIKTVRSQLDDNVKIIFAVKGDAYAHGSVPVSKRAEEEEVDMLAVANAFEANELREEGINLPILILGLSRKEHIEKLVNLDLSVTIADLEFAESLNKESKRQGKLTSVHVKVDTGLGRIGIEPDETLDFCKELAKLKNLHFEGIFSHLSVSNSPKPDDRKYTLKQIGKFREVLANLDEKGLLPPLRHIANTGGFSNYSEETLRADLNSIRVGSLLYGFPKAIDSKPWMKELKQIITITTNIVSVRKIPTGRYVGYGCTYRTDRTTRTATLPVGFSDVLDKRLSNIGYVLVKGKKAPIIGKVCADQTIIDVTDIEGVKEGDEVEITSPRFPAEEIGKLIDTTPGDLLTPAGKRVKYEYIS